MSIYRNQAIVVLLYAAKIWGYNKYDQLDHAAYIRLPVNVFIYHEQNSNTMMNSQKGGSVSRLLKSHRKMHKLFLKRG